MLEGCRVVVVNGLTVVSGGYQACLVLTGVSILFNTCTSACVLLVDTYSSRKDDQLVTR
jgi:hypothetical protein